MIALAIPLDCRLSPKSLTHRLLRIPPIFFRMFGGYCFRLILAMATHALGKLADRRPTKHYFAYGSNLHLKQMKRRCPNSKYIGHARLRNYRWQINERGYANVIEAEGHCVDGLVYEIDGRDEAKLDINEGVSKNAYTKHHMTVQLHRANAALYRRPTSWIVNKGGPAKVCRLAKVQTPTTQYLHWEQEVLVYISLNYIEDSAPKDEYVDRINLGLADAKVLGIEDDYVRNCIRPFIPEPAEKSQGSGSGDEKEKQTNKGVKRGASPRTGEQSPSRKGQAPNRPEEQTLPRALSTTGLRSTNNNSGTGSKKVFSGVTAPALPPRPAHHFHNIPIIRVEEFNVVGRAG